LPAAAGSELKWPCEKDPFLPNDWPYADCPDTLPRLGLRILDPIPCKLDAFSDPTHQGINFAEPAEVIVIVRRRRNTPACRYGAKPARACRSCFM